MKPNMSTWDSGLKCQKREGLNPVQELDRNSLDQKRRKSKKQIKSTLVEEKLKDEEKNKDGNTCEAAPPSPISIIAWNCQGLRSSLAVRSLTDEVKAKDPLLVFLAEMKANMSRIRGIQNKINFMQGIIFLSDGRSGGLTMLWKEGTDVSFKSCSNSHINVVIRDGSNPTPWQATSFYGHPEVSKRYISW